MSTTLRSEEVPYSQIADYMRKSDNESPLSQNGYALQQFENAKKIIDNYFDLRLKNARSDADKKMYLEQQFRATIGHPEAVEEIKMIIRQQIEQNTLHDIPYPPIYLNLVDALFHETWGLGVVSVWYEQHRDIGKCRVNGRSVRYKKAGEKHRLHEQYRDLKDVYRLIDNLMKNDFGQILSRDHNFAELEMYDGTRVVITVPSMIRVPTVVFRRSTLDHYTLQAQASMDTISNEGLSIYRMLARCGCKMIITGEPGTGKSTFILTLFTETDPNLITVSAENHPELNFASRFPDRDISEFLGDEKTLVPVVFPRTLRMDAQQYVIGEVREVEASILKEACRNTTGMVITSMHDWSSVNVPGTLARKELRHSSGLNYRIALTDFAEAIDFVFVMKYDEDQTVLRNAEISEIVFNPIDLSVKSRRIMWFNGTTWCWNSNISKNLQERMRLKDPSAFEEGIRVLRELEKRNPIPELEREIELSYGEKSIV